MIAKLPSHTEAESQDLLDSGDYDDSTDVVVQAVHGLAERRKGLERLRALIQVGIEEYERGEYHEFAPELRKRLRETGLRRYEAGERPSPDVCPCLPDTHQRTGGAGLQWHLAVSAYDLGT